MFDINEITDVMAERRLYLEGKPELIIRVLIGKPQKIESPTNNEFMLCPYQIMGIGDEKVRSAGGVDAVQALQLALEMIGSELYFKLNPQHHGLLRWDAGKVGDLGFPIPPGLQQ